MSRKDRAPVPVESATPQPQEFFCITRAPRPYAQYYCVKSIKVLDGLVVEGPKQLSEADTYPLTEAKLRRVVLTERGTK